MLLVLVGAGPAGRAALLLWSGCLAGAAPLPGPPPARGGPPLPAALSGFRGVAGRLAHRGCAVVGLGVSSGPCWPSGPVWGPGVGGLARARPLGVCLAPPCPAPAFPPATPRARAACLVACCLAHRVGAGLPVARWPSARQPAAAVARAWSLHRVHGMLRGLNAREELGGFEGLIQRLASQGKVPGRQRSVGLSTGTTGGLCWEAG